MKYLIAMLAVALFAVTPLAAQDDDIITLPSGEKVRIVEKDGERVLRTVEDANKEPEAEKETEEETKVRFLRPLRVGKILERSGKACDEDADEDVELRVKVEDLVKRVRLRIEDDEVEREAWSEDDAEDFHARIKKRMEEMRKQLEEMRKEIEREFEGLGDDWENDPDAEVEEWEEVSPDGKTIKKVKIIRIRKTSKSGDESPRKSEEETERKQ